MGYQIGIDLGTTNSVVAFLETSKPEVIHNAEGSNVTPSVVLYRSGEEVIVGELAKRQVVTNPEQTVSSVKRLIGRRFKEVEEKEKYFHCKLEEDPVNSGVLIDLGWRKVSPIEVSAEILKKLKHDAEEYLGETVDQAVITVPAYFNDGQRSETKKAAELAGLDVIRIINEPTAAALAYGINREKSETIAVFDFGGGTLDVSILELDGNVFEVRSTNGDTFLGGDNIDQRIFEFIKKEIEKETGINIEGNIQSAQRVKEVSEKVKCELSSLDTTTISLPFIVSDSEGPKHFQRTFARDEMNRLIVPVLEGVIPPCRNALMDAGLTPKDIDAVLLVGGSSRIVKVKEIVTEFFGKEPIVAGRPEEMVAIGAAIQGGVICGTLQEVLLLDVTPLSLGIELADDLFSVIIPRNSNVPTTASKRFTTVVDNQRNVFIHVLQGERKIASQNRSLAHFKLTDISQAPREVPEIEVKFNLDANGILNVGAMDMTSGISKEIRIESYQTSIPIDYEKEIREAEEKEEEDKAYVKKVRKKERARHIIDFFNKFIKDEEANIQEEDRETFRNYIGNLELALEKQDFDEVEQWITALQAMLEKYRNIFMRFKTDD
ncbi:molecular chaperone DnaK [Candidatus Sumerlaeota bacterium]|nr:molecular chaperone DnaK [Candidatus Sumerlaeota bacterium]